jgi:hypothetical protein
MCDYSLCGLPTRLAAEGERLVVHRFPTGSMGLVSPRELSTESTPKPASERSIWQRVGHVFESPAFQAQRAPVVCMPPGASLVLKDISPELQRRYGIEREEPVTFVQTSAMVNSYRDAVQFRNGQQVLLQNLPEGLQVDVLSLAPSYLHEELEFPAMRTPA